MCAKFSKNMKYFVLVLVLCSGFLCQNVLSEKLESQEQLLDGKNFNLNNEAYNQENHVIEDQLTNNAGTCTDDNECRNGGICEANGFCLCKLGIIGDKCEHVWDCIHGKYRGCEISGGQCKYNDSNAVCECTSYTKYHYIEHACKDCYCGKNSKSCQFDPKGVKECNCSYGYSENHGYCEVIDSTTSEDTTVVTSTVLTSTTQECNCGPYGSCSFEYGQKQCDCMSFTIEKHGVCVVMESTTPEDTTIVTSTLLTSTAQECNCGPYGSCSFENGQKQCDCIPFAIEIHGVCVVMESTTPEDTTVVTSTVLTSTAQDCYCGENSKSCHFNWKGDKICNCSPGYAENNGQCDECNCGPYGSCNFKYGQKHCDCRSFAIEKNGVCIVMETTSSEDTTIETSTVIPSTAQDCHCGSFSYSCSLDSAGNKVCNCFVGHSQLGGSCAECNCGPYGACSYEYGRKKCNCRSFAAEMNGVCVAICSEDKCVHGKCERIGKGFRCRCKEGYTGYRCEDKIQITSNKQDLWKIILVSIAFAIFILLSGVLCSMTRMLNKISKISK